MKGKIFYSIIACAVILNGCYYDKLNEIHPVVNSNDVCSETTAATYTASIDLILRTSCVSCHNSNLQSGGVNLASYDKVKMAATSGKLLGAIQHSPGYQAMPPGTSIRTCEIQKIENWVNTQMPN
jgi:mono/diheme cytochrome c family protein